MEAPFDVQVSVNVANGDVLSGVVQFRVTVRAEHAITQVEFYVGNDLRETDSSTPYSFTFDTLNEDDGEVTLAFAAYTSEGGRGRKEVTVKIDNGVSKGAEHHIERALEFLTESKWDEALLAGRLALRADAQSVRARLVMARANLGKGVYDLAQKFAEDGLALDPGNRELQLLLSSVNVRRALSILDRPGSDRMDTIRQIGQSLQAAARQRTELRIAEFEAVGPVTNENRLRYADAAIRAGRYSAAIAALQNQLATTSDVANVANRLIYAQIRAGRYTDAVSAMRLYKQRRGVDAYGYALDAVLQFMQGNREASTEALKEAQLSDQEDLGVRLAQAWLALAENNTARLRPIATGLAREQDQLPQVNYYLATLNRILNEFTQSRKYFQEAVIVDPAFEDMYIERGNESFKIVMGAGLEEKDREYELAVAREFFQTALAVKEDSAQALTGMALVAMGQNKSVSDMVSFARAAAVAGPQYAPAHYTLSGALTIAARAQRAAADNHAKEGRAQEAREMNALAAQSERDAIAAMQLAGQLDRVNLQGRIAPTVVQAWNYFYQYGRNLVITAPR